MLHFVKAFEECHQELFKEKTRQWTRNLTHLLVNVGQLASSPFGLCCASPQCPAFFFKSSSNIYLTWNGPRSRVGFIDLHQRSTALSLLPKPIWQPRVLLNRAAVNAPWMSGSPWAVFAWSTCCFTDNTKKWTTLVCGTMKCRDHLSLWLTSCSSNWSGFVFSQFSSG